MQALLQTLLNGLVAGTVLAVPAIGFTAIFAVLRYPNFAIGSIACFGAYAGLFANTVLHLPLEASLVFAFAVAGAVAVATEAVAIQPLEKAGALMMAIASLAAGIVLENILRFAFGNDLRGFDTPILRDWRFGDLRVGPQQVENFVIALLLMLAVWGALGFTRIGRAMRAVADNPDLARLKGVEPKRIAAITVFFGAGLAGVGGMLNGVDASVDPMTGARLLLSIFAASVLGGLGSIPGAVAGALVIGLAEEATVLAFAPAYRSAVSFLVILLVLTFRPAGFFGQKAA